MTTKRPTIDDVARLSGVARVTVSRVLNGGPNVRDEVRALRRQLASAAAGDLVSDAIDGVLVANDGRDASEQLTRRVPQLLLTDLEMPELSGFELIERLVDSEMVVFEWLRSAEHPDFKAVQALIK